MNSTNNLARIFHSLIITIFLLSMSACGYKAPPFYVDQAEQTDTPNTTKDQNVEFIQKQSDQNHDK